MIRFDPPLSRLEIAIIAAAVIVALIAGYAFARQADILLIADLMERGE